MKKFFILTILVLLSAGYASTAAAFLDNGIAARSEGMGRAFTAVADDLDAFYYNPAGYGFQDKTRVNTMAAKMDNETNVYYAGFGGRLFRGYSALNVYTAGIDDIPETQYVNGRIVDSGNSFQYSSRAIYLSYATGLLDFLQMFKVKNEDLNTVSFGFSLKNIHESLDKKSASGMGLDAGLMYKLDDISIGYAVLNLIEPVMVWDTESKEKDTVERVQKFGLSWQVQKDLKLSGDLTLRKNDSVSGVGAEYVLFDLVALRAGMLTNKYAVGLGLNNYEGFNFDYVYLISADSLVENTHKFSLGYMFGGGKQENKALKPAASAPVSPSAVSIPVKTTQAVTAAPTPAVPTAAAVQVTMLKRNILSEKDKLKCFYKIENTGAAETTAELTVILVSATDKVIDKRTQNLTLKPQQETLAEEALYIAAVKPGKYRVKTYLKIDTETTDYLDSVDLK